MKTLTKTQIDAKASELSKKFDNKVTPMVIEANGEQIIGYFQEPSYDTIMYFIDAYHNKEISKAGDAAMRDCLITEESDPRIASTERKNSRIRASFSYACVTFLSPHADAYKAMHNETKKKSEGVSTKEQKH